MLWLFKTALWIIFSHNYYICTQSFACRFMYHREIHECSQNQVFWFHPGFSAYVIHLFVNFSEIKLSINHLWYISYIDEKWCTWSVELSELLNMSENPPAKWHVQCSKERNQHACSGHLQTSNVAMTLCVYVLKKD